jgi:hypothetical protein
VLFSGHKRCVALAHLFLRVYSPYSNEILYTKALEYKEYFTHIAVPQITKSSREIQDLVDMKFRILGQAVSKYMIVSVCVMF